MHVSDQEVRSLVRSGKCCMCAKCMFKFMTHASFASLKHQFLEEPLDKFVLVTVTIDWSICLTQ